MSHTSKQFYVLSPDGFPIERDATYPTPKTAWAAFENWKKGYERQGYYSTIRNNERVKIAVEELKENCTLKEINS